jgi:hypothetical protein
MLNPEVRTLVPGAKIGKENPLFTLVHRSMIVTHARRSRQLPTTRTYLKIDFLSPRTMEAGKIAV